MPVSAPLPAQPRNLVQGVSNEAWGHTALELG